MKKLDLNQMESISGSLKNRSCLLAGAGAAVGVIAGIATGGAVAAGWLAFGGASWLTGVAGDCF